MQVLLTQKRTKAKTTELKLCLWARFCWNPTDASFNKNFWYLAEARLRIFCDYFHVHAVSCNYNLSKKNSGSKIALFFKKVIVANVLTAKVSIHRPFNSSVRESIFSSPSCIPRPLTLSKSFSFPYVSLRLTRWKEKEERRSFLLHFAQFATLFHFSSLP